MNAPVTEGQVLAGKYLVERVLGKGGMGVVVAATHQQLQQRIAIKLLLPGADSEATQRFLREARAAVRLKSEHVARVTDVGELDDGTPYMVMEYLEGDDLSRLVRKHGPLPIEEAATYVLHACEAMAEAHAAGIIHRDIKPANLFLTTAADGSRTVKVLDFGISKTPLASAAPGAEPAMALTQTETILGSPLYMAPEQMRSARAVDIRADIWSIGAVLYQLLTATVPFDTTSLADLILMINTQEPPPPRAHRPDLPEALEAAILRCLRKHRDERFANVAELAQAIAPFAPMEEVARCLPRILRTLGLTATVPMNASRAISSAAMASASAIGTSAAEAVVRASQAAIPAAGSPSSPREGMPRAAALSSAPPAVAHTVQRDKAGMNTPSEATPPVDWISVDTSRRTRSLPSTRLAVALTAVLALGSGAVFAVMKLQEPEDGGAALGNAAVESPPPSKPNTPAPPRTATDVEVTPATSAPEPIASSPAPPAPTAVRTATARTANRPAPSAPSSRPTATAAATAKTATPKPTSTTTEDPFERLNNKGIH